MDQSFSSICLIVVIVYSLFPKQEEYLIVSPSFTFFRLTKNLLVLCPAKHTLPCKILLCSKRPMPCANACWEVPSITISLKLIEGISSVPIAFKYFPFSVSDSTGVPAIFCEFSFI